MTLIWHVLDWRACRKGSIRLKWRSQSKTKLVWSSISGRTSSTKAKGKQKFESNEWTSSFFNQTVQHWRRHRNWSYHFNVALRITLCNSLFRCSALLVDLNDRQIYIEMRIDQTLSFIVLVFLEPSQLFHCHEHAVLRSLKTIHLKIFHQSNHQKTHSKRQYKIKFTSGS